MMVNFRLAPTPSGFLHEGNALNFVLIAWQCKLKKGKLRLRIDDHDEGRTRREYVENIFRVIEWLGIEYDLGPTSVADFERNYSQKLKKTYYFEELMKLKGKLFPCECSRKDLIGYSKYPGTCYEKELDFKKNAIRLRTDNFNNSLSDSMKNCIMWRKDNLPSYQLVSLIEDRDDEITHLIRGEDLKESSDFQVAFSREFDWKFPQFLWHHNLLTQNGEKISKSQKASSVLTKYSTTEEFYSTVISDFFNTPVKNLQDLTQKVPDTF